MNFRLVFMLSLTGVAVALATTTGLLHRGVETIVWLALCVVLSVLVALRAPSRPFVHGLFVGLLSAVLCQLVQAAMLDRYLANNPSAAEDWKRLPPGMSPRVVLVVLSPVIGAIYGVVIGTLAWLIARFVRRRPAAA